MKKLVGLFLMLGLFAFTLDQDPEQDPKAKSVLDKVSAKNKAYKSIAGDFTNKMVNKAQGIDRSTNGSFILKGDKYFLKLGVNEIYYDGTDRVRYNKDDNEYEYMEGNDQMDPSEMLTNFSAKFKYKHQGKVTLNGASHDKIYLYPKDVNEAYHRVELYVTSDFQVSKFVTVNKDQTQFIILLNNLKYNVAYPDSKFAFTPPPGAEEL